MVRTLVVAAVAIGAPSVTAIFLSPAAAAAAPAPPEDPIPPVPDPYGYNYGATQDGHRAHQRQAPGKTAVPKPAADSGNTDAQIPEHTCQPWVGDWKICTPVQSSPAPRAPTVSPAQLAATTWRRLPIPAPRVATAPPRGSDALVGLAEWFWVTNWSTHTDRAAAGTQWAQVTAHPTNVTINPGAGLPAVTCGGPGTAYNPKRAAAAQHSECSYTYQRSSAGLPRSAYRVQVSVTWGGSWTGSGDTGGTLPAITRTASFDLRVAEGQAVTGG